MSTERNGSALKRWQRMAGKQRDVAFQFASTTRFEIRVPPPTLKTVWLQMGYRTLAVGSSDDVAS